ncbi:MAG: flagellar biosynthetic protein FliO [Burkholderiaceae bacterium]
MDAGFNIVWAVLMLVVVVAAVPASVWLMRKLPGFKPVGGSTLTVCETLSLGPRERLLVVRSGDRYLLLGATPQAVNLVCELANYPDSDLSPGQSFASQLKKAGDESRR